MLKYDKKKTAILLALFFIACLLVYEYWKNPGEIDSSTIMAKVRGRAITVAEYNDAMRLAALSKYVSPDTLKARFEVLDGLIMKELLVQEAQKQSFDKDEAFKKEIKNYWEQALIKRLLKQKLDEIAFAVRVKDDEIKAVYARMKKKVLVETVTLYNKKSALALAAGAADFEKAKKGVEKSIISDEPQQWKQTGDLPLYAEGIVFSMKPGEVSQPIARGNNWMVIKVLSEEPVSVDSFEKLAPGIKKDIFRRKKEELFERWVDALRGNADIAINVKKLKKTKTR
jgi:parvulin-like peptidyl-prolyl isomerase